MTNERHTERRIHRFLDAIAAACSDFDATAELRLDRLLDAISDAGEPDAGSVEQALARFANMRVERLPRGFGPGNEYYAPGDERAPLMSEGFLYPLLGKEDARTVLALWREVCKSVHVDHDYLTRRPIDVHQT